MNERPGVFDTINTFTSEHGWTDVVMVAKLCNGSPGQTTCHANADAKKSRIDFFFANEWLVPAITACDVDQCDDYPTHRPFRIEVNTKQLENHKGAR